MRAIVCEQPGTLSLQTLKDPQRIKDECLLRVMRVGICGTDLHAFKGNQPFFSYPRILGHELATQVIDPHVGSSLKPGDKVVLIPYINCEKCPACLSGKSNCCESLRVF